MGVQDRDDPAFLKLLKAPGHHIECRSGGLRDGDNFVGDVPNLIFFSRRAISASSAFKLKSAMVPIPVGDVDTSQRARTRRAKRNATPGFRHENGNAGTSAARQCIAVLMAPRLKWIEFDIHFKTSLPERF
jgi:hypothetical protein